MRALVIQPDPTCGPGLIGQALEHRGYRLCMHHIVPPEAGAVGVPWTAPELAEHNALVVLGARWSVYDATIESTWLPELVALLRRAHAAQVPTLGICFGAQALARALGGVVEPAPRPEVGWTCIHTEVPELVPAGPWFQWHGDRFTVPENAELLAHTSVGPQAFRLRSSLGVQFHPELTPEILENWLEDDEMLPAAAGVNIRDLRSSTASECRAAPARTDAFVETFVNGHHGHEASGLASSP